MCGILGIFSSNLNSVFNNYEFESLANSISHRGKSGFGMLDSSSNKFYKKFEDIDFKNMIVNNSNQVMFHALHSITEFTKQPLENSFKKSIVLFNGEIYNFKELSKKYGFESVESDTLFLQKYLDSFSIDELLNNMPKIVEGLNGDFAICYKREDYVFMLRDNLGVKPLFYHYSDEKGCIVISEKTNVFEITEVNPREIVIFNVETKSITKVSRNFYGLMDEVLDLENKIQEKVWDLLVESIKKRIPQNSNKKIGVLFSGGIDSTVIVLILKQLGIKFTCYSAKCSSNSLEEADDFIYAQRISKQYNLDFKYVDIDVKELENLTKDVISIIDDTNYIKVSVALPFLASCRLAQEDEIDVMFSGLGSEEIFAGYRRHKQCDNVNLECLEGLKILHERDLYRDDVITMSCTQELRVPFLDKELIDYCLKIPAKYKLDVEKVKEIKNEVYKKPYLNALVQNKIILRECAKRFLNLEDEYANRLKKAAQYGSKFDKGLLRLAKDKNMNKEDYLKSLNNIQ